MKGIEGPHSKLVTLEGGGTFSAQDMGPPGVSLGNPRVAAGGSTTCGNSDACTAICLKRAYVYTSNVVDRPLTSLHAGAGRSALLRQVYTSRQVTQQPLACGHRRAVISQVYMLGSNCKDRGLHGPCAATLHSAGLLSRATNLFVLLIPARGVHQHHPRSGSPDVARTAARQGAQALRVLRVPHTATWAA
jgi:hypothetical protein